MDYTSIKELFDLKNKVVVVTGAGGVLYSTISTSLAGQGANGGASL